MAKRNEYISNDEAVDLLLDTPEARARLLRELGRVVPDDLAHWLFVGCGSFEELDGDVPKGWRTMTHDGGGKFAVDGSAMSGERSVKITSEDGGDLSWSQDVRLQPNTRYRLSAWVRS